MKERRDEFSKVLVFGAIATAVDYMTLNLLVVMLGVWPLLANLLSSTLGSYYSYRLNKSITYQGRMHSRKRTLLVYTSIVVSGIVMFQVGVFYLLNSVFEAPTEYVLRFIDDAVHEVSFNESVVRLNVAKVAATVCAGLWSYLMMRHFVYATSHDERHRTDS